MEALSILMNMQWPLAFVLVGVAAAVSVPGNGPASVPRAGAH